MSEEYRRECATLAHSVIDEIAATPECTGTYTLHVRHGAIEKIKGADILLMADGHRCMHLTPSSGYHKEEA